MDKEDTPPPEPPPPHEMDTEEEVEHELEQLVQYFRENSVPAGSMPTRVTEPREDPDDDINDVIENNGKNVCIVVLGDIARSPRMRYHATSFANEGYHVHMIGYGGSKIPLALVSNNSINYSLMMEPPAFLKRLPRLLAYPLKVAWQWLFLAWTFIWMLLRYHFRPNFILLQNPPAIPTMILCWLYSFVFWCPFIIDWHNYGFSLMAIVHGKQNYLVRFATWFENFFGSKADGHLCVTRAMKEDLKKTLNVDAVIFYDRPPMRFRSIPEEEKITFLRKMSTDFPSLMGIVNSKNPKHAPKILVSATSWTEDENFNILLSALEEYELASDTYPDSFPHLIVFITGKGPQKEFYRNIITSLNFKNVEINLPWLEDEDYPKLLACADLGISLHFSSSGLDLPMKVVDMFGCCLPVCAINFNCISELVKHGENSMVFDDSTELAQQIQDWFRIRKTPNSDHSKFRENLRSFQSIRWHENWRFYVQPLFR